MDRQKTARKNLLRKSQEVKGTVVKGYDFNQGIDYEKIVNNFATMGFQAKQLSKAIEIVNWMIA